MLQGWKTRHVTDSFVGNFALDSRVPHRPRIRDAFVGPLQVHGLHEGSHSLQVFGWPRGASCAYGWPGGRTMKGEAASAGDAGRPIADFLIGRHLRDGRRRREGGFGRRTRRRWIHPEEDRRREVVRRAAGRGAHDDEDFILLHDTLSDHCLRLVRLAPEDRNNKSYFNEYTLKYVISISIEKYGFKFARSSMDLWHTHGAQKHSHVIFWRSINK